MNDRVTDYFTRLSELFHVTTATRSSGEMLGLSESMAEVIRLLKTVQASGNKVLFIGNGGSSAISSHMAVDFWKNGNIPAMSFNDGPQLTCLGNDFGFEHVFAKPIEMFARSGDLLFAFSSSGNSANILCGVEIARRQGCGVITLSGFSGNNLLRTAGDLNFYVPSDSYGLVEIMHHSICHAILDLFVSGELSTSRHAGVSYSVVPGIER